MTQNTTKSPQENNKYLCESESEGKKHVYSHLYLNAWQTMVQCLLEEIEAKQLLLLLEIGLHNMSIHKCTLELCIYVKTFKEQHSNQFLFL